MTIADRFSPYGAVDAGICVIAYERTSPIIYCNRLFSALVSASPNQLTGCSLDELSKSRSLIYDSARPISTAKVGFVGGFCVQLYDQVAEGMLRTLRIYRIEREDIDGQIFLVGYVRKATRFEVWLYKTRLDTDLDPYWKPLASLLLSGHWRPWLTAASPIWMPYVVAHWPQLQTFIETVIAQ